jgi:DNA-binding response OmpR family regulator
MRRVLIIDDNQMLANLYRSALEAGGFAVEIAADGEAGLSHAQVTAPDGSCST